MSKLSPMEMMKDSSRKKRIYVSGRMTGLPEFNYPEFNRRSEILAEMGWDVWNPAAMPFTGITADGEIPNENNSSLDLYARIIRRDFAGLLTCDAMYMLADWWKSPGASCEWALAKNLDLEIFYENPLPEMVSKENDTRWASEEFVNATKTK